MVEGCRETKRAGYLYTAKIPTAFGNTDVGKTGFSSSLS